MGLQLTYDSIDQIPSDLTIADLFEERDGRMVLVGVEGMKTSSDVASIQKSLVAERNLVRDLKEQLKVWGDLDPEQVNKSLDEIEELRLRAAEGGASEEKINELVEARIARKIAPLDRELKRRTENESRLTEELNSLRGDVTRTKIERAVREATGELKIRSDAFDDVLLHAERVLEVAEDGAVVTKDGVGVTPGLQPRDWLGDLVTKKSYWFEGSKGGGADGAGQRGRGAADPSNPFSKAGWNATAQAALIRTDRGRAEQLAKAAGSKIGAIEPPSA